MICCKSFISHNKQDHSQFSMGFRWVLLKLFLKVLHNIKYNYKTTASFWMRLWMSDLYVLNIICFQTQRWFWLIYVHIILCTQKPLCVHVQCALVMVHEICRALYVFFYHMTPGRPVFIWCSKFAWKIILLFSEGINIIWAWIE